MVQNIQPKEYVKRVIEVFESRPDDSNGNMTELRRGIAIMQLKMEMTTRLSTDQSGSFCSPLDRNTLQRIRADLTRRHLFEQILKHFVEFYDFGNDSFSIFVQHQIFHVLKQMG